MGTQKNAINLGSGKRPLPGYWNLDRLWRPTLHLQADFLHLPFLDGSIEKIVMDHSLEHVPLHQALLELYRVLPQQGQIIIYVPHVSGIGFWSDPTHRQAFTYRTWDYLGQYDLPYFRLCSRQLHWRERGRFPKFDYLLNRWPRWAEKYLAPWIGGIHEIAVVLSGG